MLYFSHPISLHDQLSLVMRLCSSLSMDGRFVDILDAILSLLFRVFNTTVVDGKTQLFFIHCKQNLTCICIQPLPYTLSDSYMISCDNLPKCYFYFFHQRCIKMNIMRRKIKLDEQKILHVCWTAWYQTCESCCHGS